MRAPGLRVTLTALSLAAASLAAVAPLAGQVPTPADVIGFAPGTDFKLADYDQVVAYFRALDAASDRVVLEEIGKSTLGKPMMLAVISTEANIRDRERYRDIARRLALAENLTDDQARALAREGKAVVWFDGGLHATEVAHGQLMPELAWHFATDESEETRRIRESSIILIMANMNPDGLDIVSHWYRQNVGTPFETAPVPELYHPYIGHDNNRDWTAFTQVETQAVANQLYNVWYPQIVYNHHQSGPFPGRIWTPPFENPVNPNLDPLVVSSINQIGEAMRKRFDLEGKPGQSSGIVYDMWWNGSMRGAPDFHNMLGFLTETALYQYATPGCYAPEDIPETFGPRASNLPAKTPSTGYTNPWLGGCWHLRDAMDYMTTASLAVADLASRLKEDYLFNIYWMGKRQAARGARGEGGPFAYVVDLGAQHDAPTAVEFLRILRIAGIEVHQSEAPFTAGGKRYPTGTYVIGPQAFRPFVVDMMEPKAYPDRRLYPGGPPEPPYDMTGYELRFQLGVTVDRVLEPFAIPGPAVDRVAAAPGSVQGSGAVHLMAPDANASVSAVNRLLAGGASVSRAVSPFQAAGHAWPAGTFIVQGADATSAAAAARELGLNMVSVAAAPPVTSDRLHAPRVGIYKSWVAAMPEGWTRWLMEGYGFAYQDLTNKDIQSGDLSAFDIIIIPSQSANAIFDGHREGRVPAEYVGGLGAAGTAALKRYAEAGGWILAFDEAVDYAIDRFGLPVKNVVRGVDDQDFFIPGSLIRVGVDTSDPMGWGLTPEATAMFAGSQTLEVTPDAPSGVQVFSRYASEDWLLSGWDLGGAEYLAGRAAGVGVPLGQGQVVLLGFTPHFRGQSRNTYKLLFNPILQAASERVPIS
jgi:hypothetical protein